LPADLRDAVDDLPLLSQTKGTAQNFELAIDACDLDHLPAALLLDATPRHEGRDLLLLDAVQRRVSEERLERDQRVAVVGFGFCLAGVQGVHLLLEATR